MLKPVVAAVILCFMSLPAWAQTEAAASRAGRSRGRGAANGARVRQPSGTGLVEDFEG